VPLLRISCIPVVLLAYLFDSKVLSVGCKVMAQEQGNFLVSVLNVRNCVYGKRWA
jgi:hypothetical protein